MYILQYTFQIYFQRTYQKLDSMITFYILVSPHALVMYCLKFEELPPHFHVLDGFLPRLAAPCG